MSKLVVRFGFGKKMLRLAEKLSEKAKKMTFIKEHVRKYSKKNT